MTALGGASGSPKLLLRAETIPRNSVLVAQQWVHGRGLLLPSACFLCTPGAVVFPAREQPGISDCLLLGRTHERGSSVPRETAQFPGSYACGWADSVVCSGGRSVQLA